MKAKTNLLFPRYKITLTGMVKHYFEDLIDEKRSPTGYSKNHNHKIQWMEYAKEASEVCLDRTDTSGIISLINFFSNNNFNIETILNNMEIKRIEDFKSRKQ